jgi:hypothetical protein
VFSSACSFWWWWHDFISLSLSLHFIPSLGATGPHPHTISQFPTSIPTHPFQELAKQISMYYFGWLKWFCISVKT